MRGGEEEEEEVEESGGMAANKTRTPHRDVGKKQPDNLFQIHAFNIRKTMEDVGAVVQRTSGEPASPFVGLGTASSELAEISWHQCSNKLEAQRDASDSSIYL